MAAICRVHVYEVLTGLSAECGVDVDEFGSVPFGGCRWTVVEELYADSGRGNLVCDPAAIVGIVNVELENGRLRVFHLLKASVDEVDFLAIPFQDLCEFIYALWATAALADRLQRQKIVSTDAEGDRDDRAALPAVPFQGRDGDFQLRADELARRVIPRKRHPLYGSVQPLRGKTGEDRMGGAKRIPAAAILKRVAAREIDCGVVSRPCRCGMGRAVVER